MNRLSTYYFQIVDNLFIYLFYHVIKPFSLIIIYIK